MDNNAVFFIQIVILSSCFILLHSTITLARYVATGPYEGEVCKGFIIEACSYERLDAIKKDGQLYNISQSWDKVDEYSNGRCWFFFRQGATGKFLNRPPEFYQKNDSGEWVKINVGNSVRFKCEER